MQRALRDIDDIYNYIADNFKEIGTVEKVANVLDKAIRSLSDMPKRGSVRKTGAFANWG
jgi:plasmid stabilization system protein ParE